MQNKFFTVSVVPTPPTSPPVDAVPVFLVIVVAGVMLRLAWLTFGVIRLSQFSRRATEVAPPPAAAALEAEVGVSPRYILQTGNRGPWTFGRVSSDGRIARRDSMRSRTAFQRAVICHELLHIKRRDIMVALLEELAVATLWFHPWAWLLRARIRTAREQVVDAQVVQLVGNRDEYVRCLIDISGHDLAPHFSQAGAGMLRPRELRARVDAMFQEVPMSSRRLVAVTCALMMAVGATTYMAAAALPMRSWPIVDPTPLVHGRTIVEMQAGFVPQVPGTTSTVRVNPAINEPINLSFARTPQAAPSQAAPTLHARKSTWCIRSIRRTRSSATFGGRLSSTSR